MLDTRAALIAANEKVADAATAVQQAEELVTKAASALARAKADHAAASGVKSQTFAWRVAALKQGSNEPLPPDLIEARREAVFAAEELEQAAAVAEHVERELATAKANLKAAEAAKKTAAAQVVFEHVRTLAVEVEALGKRRAYLRQVLHAATLGEAPQHLQQEFNNVLSNAAYDVQEPQLVYPPKAKGAEAYWSDIVAALVADANAPIGEPPAPDKLWT